MKIGTIYDISFSTNRADTGALSSADSTPVVRVTENGVNLAYLPTVSTLSTGVYLVSIDASLANGFEVGKRYSVYCTATVNTIDGAIGLDSFTVDTRGIDDVLPTASYTTPPTAVAIRTEIDTNSTKLDVATSTRLATAGYTAPDNATISAIQTEVNSHPTLVEIEASTVLAQVSDIPTVGDIRTELSPELSLINLNLDAKVSEAGGTGGGISWDDIIADNSSVQGSFGQKFAQYGGVSHVIDRSTFDEESKKRLDKFEEGLKKLLEAKPTESKVEIPIADIMKEVNNLIAIPKETNIPIEQLKAILTSIPTADSIAEKIPVSQVTDLTYIEEFISEVLPELLKELGELKEDKTKNEEDLSKALLLREIKRLTDENRNLKLLI